MTRLNLCYLVCSLGVLLASWLMLETSDYNLSFYPAFGVQFILDKPFTRIKEPPQPSSPIVWSSLIFNPNFYVALCLISACISLGLIMSYVPLAAYRDLAGSWYGLTLFWVFWQSGVTVRYLRLRKILLEQFQTKSTFTDLAK